MKSVLVLVSFICVHSCWASDAKAITHYEACRFTSLAGEIETFEKCAVRLKGGTFKIQKSIVPKIRFNSIGLAGGSVGQEGCFWLRKDRTLRKTHCYDNGADEFSEGLARFVDSKGRFGFMNQRLKVVVPATYTFAFPFEKGMARVCNGCVSESDGEHSKMVGGEWLLIEKSGRVKKKCAEAKDFSACR